MARAFGGRPTSSFFVCPLFSDYIGLPQGEYVDFPRLREWETTVNRYRAPFAAFGIRPQDVCICFDYQNRRLLYIGPHAQECLAGRLGAGAPPTPTRSETDCAIPGMVLVRGALALFDFV